MANEDRAITEEQAKNNKWWDEDEFQVETINRIVGDVCRIEYISQCGRPYDLTDKEKAIADIRRHIQYVSFRISLPNDSRFKAGISRKTGKYELSMSSPFTGFNVRTDTELREKHR